ncbi:GNAT family N-acetyltransferase [Legionella hackeliae]|uniref:Putative GCN5-related N-acetyltransferase n=1 Tax=Legionella hackeliae TaxID=449 RepID=A0A0A8UTE7_LEGHA|nr:GNAT family N-acetyltransferase [Legionella hackeliae]KTD05798.1 N-acetyltransferase ats1 [Legionella hackeliae]CEK10372.1 putative GCN5-related N-acetyltransferase [Legionella hackeliae]STX47108.1 N-acetyltransferase ats1 [Legionella hackeliae]
MKKEVRFAVEDDFDFIYETLTEDLKEQGVLYRFKYSKHEFKTTIFGEKPLATFLILIIDGKKAGFANFSIDYRNFTVNSKANMYLNDLFVAKQYRRKRGAALLMKRLEEIAIQENCGRIEGVVLSNNVEALEFYKKFLNGKIISDKLHYMRLELNSDRK